MEFPILHKFYDYNSDMNKDYASQQINRHFVKRDKKRSRSHYLRVFELLQENDHPTTGKMLCLGTRNNWEKEVFQEFLPLVKVYSSDISPCSGADYILDFNDLRWVNYWDLIYSNAIDHSPEPLTALKQWACALKEDGVMAVGFDTKPEISAADCTSFDISKFEIYFTGCLLRKIDSYLYVVGAKSDWEEVLK